MHAQKNVTPVIGLIGLGFWGEKLLLSCRDLNISVVVTDMDPKRREYIHARYPDISVASSVNEIFTAQSVIACIIATPPLTHFSLAVSALTHRKHVLVEKPMTQDSEEAKKLIHLAIKHKCILMVDHIFLFSPVIHTVKRYIEKGAIGQITMIKSVRERGRIHKGSCALWDLAPHDISIASFLLDGSPVRARILTPHAYPKIIEDAAYQLTYPNHVTLEGRVSWITPVKKRQMEIIGKSGAMTIRWDSGSEQLTLYKPSKGKYSFHTQKTYNRTPKEPPMNTMLRHFLTSMKHNQSPLTDGRHALQVIQAISALHTSHDHKGASVQI